jgi:ligand-binding sensor domain-containing protein/DNA-binding CsgD family transcriptional regulator
LIKPFKEMTRKQKSKAACFMVFLLVLLLPAPADEPPVRIEHLTIADGLIANTVISLLEDSRGFLWVGFEGGFNFYDGYGFHRYANDPENKNSSSHFYNFDFAEDNNGNLWLATQQGLCRLDYHTRMFSYFSIDPENSKSPVYNWVTRIFSDGEGYLWLGTEGNGLVRFHIDTAAITRHYRHRPDNARSIDDDYIKDIYRDSKGNLWICTRSGVNRFNRTKESFSRYRPADSVLHRRQFYRMTEDNQGRLWIGSSRGLFLFDPGSGSFKLPFEGRSDNAWLQSCLITSMVLDPHGSLWVGTRSMGLGRIDPQTLRVTRYLHGADDSPGISHNHISGLLVDSNGILWVATYGGGLDKIVFQTKPFNHHTLDPEILPGLNSYSIHGILEDDSGTVWLCTGGGGLLRWDRSRNHFRRYRREPGDPGSLSYDFVPIIIQSNRKPNEFWIGTYYGLNRFDKSTESFTRFLNHPDQEDSLSSNAVYALLEDRYGILWVGTWGGGLNRFHRDTGTFTRYLPDRKDPSSLSHGVIWDIHEDRRGRLWIGTRGGGLNLMDRHNGSFQTFRNRPDDPASLSSDYIDSIHEDKAGILWIGTSGGLNRFDPESGQCRRYTMKDGLPDNVIYGILEGDHGELWCSTNKGLSRFNPAKKSFQNYSPSDGLQSFEFSMHSYWKNKKGELYFGGVNGFNVFTPAKIVNNLRIPQVFFTDFRIANRSAPIISSGGSPLTSSIVTTRSVTLTHKQRPITFAFSALDFTSPGRNQYAYKLAGLDDNWLYLGNTREITFAQLAPGTYTLCVRGSNSDGVWNDQGVMLDIIITPPVWQTWWFRGLMILLVLFAIVLFYRTRMKRITTRLKTEAAMERFFNKKGISPREREIILLILKGKNNKQIEDELFISLGTVKNHVYNIFRKLDINSRIQLVNLFRNLTID